MEINQNSLTSTASGQSALITAQPQREWQRLPRCATGLDRCTGYPGACGRPEGENLREMLRPLLDFMRSMRNVFGCPEAVPALPPAEPGPLPPTTPPGSGTTPTTPPGTGTTPAPTPTPPVCPAPTPPITPPVTPPVTGTPGGQTPPTPPTTPGNSGSGNTGSTGSMSEMLKTLTEKLDEVMKKVSRMRQRIRFLEKEREPRAGRARG